MPRVQPRRRSRPLNQVRNQGKVRRSNSLFDIALRETVENPRESPYGNVGWHVCPALGSALGIEFLSDRPRGKEAPRSVAASALTSGFSEPSCLATSES